jgi:hypothetical protein
MANRLLNKSQGILEATIVLVLMVLLLGGITRIWIWGNKQIVIRQKRFNATRVSAGTAQDDHQIEWPLQYQPGAAEAQRPERLTEEMVILDAPRLR